MRKVIVTGANGFVGRYLIRELSRLEYQIWAIIRDKDDDFECISGTNLNIVYCNLYDILDLEKKIDGREFECFYHLAWAESSGEGRKNYSLQLKNAEACVNAAKVASILGCKRFVGAGSVTELMYGDYLKSDLSVPEMETCYAIAKMTAEYMTRCVCVNNNIDFLWAHLTNFYGVDDPTQNFINYLVKSYSEGVVPTLTSGVQKADFMYVSDVARALVAIGKNGISGKTYYVGYGNPRPLREFVLEVRNSIDSKIETGLGRKTFQGFDVNFDLLDMDKLKIDTGFVPKIGFVEGINLIIEHVGICKKRDITHI